MSLAVEEFPHRLPEAVLAVVGDSARLAAVRELNLMDSPPDADFDRLALLTAGLLQAPLALLTVLDEHRQRFTAALGTDLREAPVEDSFCAHVLALGSAMVVGDAARDPRFAANPYVIGPPFVRFYVGVPVSVAGQPVGTLCAYDFSPRPAPSPASIEQLEALAALAGTLFALKDVSRSGMAARAALAREEKRRGIALEAASLASWAWHVDSDMIECDPALPKLFGLASATRMRARKLFTAIDRRDIAASRRSFREAIAGDGEYAGEYRVAATEPPRWLAARGRVVERDAEGRATLLFGVNYDVTERKAGEERQRLLLRELNHRVKNTLATVQALASQTVRHARDPRAFLEAFSARLQALGAAHNLLSDREWRGIGMRELAALEARPFDDAAEPRIGLQGEDVVLPPDQAMGLGLILHELGSNATKYGALSQAGGRVTVAWHAEWRGGERFLVLTWTEQGGPPVSSPAHHGFGTILIQRSLSKVLGSAVDHAFLPEGVRAVVSMPLAQAEGGFSAAEPARAEVPAAGGSPGR